MSPLDEPRPSPPTSIVSQRDAVALRHPLVAALFASLVAVPAAGRASPTAAVEGDAAALASAADFGDALPAQTRPVGDAPQDESSAGEAEEGRSAIAVRVVDPERNPLPGTQVRVFGPNRSLLREGTSDAQGRVRFPGLPAGSYEVRATLPPFRDRDRVVALEGDDLEITVVLSLTTTEESVTVTASRGSLRETLKVPATVRTLGIDELESRAPDLIPRMLSEEPGVIAQQTTPGQGSPILRGQSAQSALYLLDGVRYNNATFRGGNTQYLAWIPSVSTDAVEIQLGPSGVNYGSDALGGAINVITEPVPGRSGDGWRLDGTLRLFGESSSLGLGSDLTVGISGDRFSAFLAGTGARHQDLRAGGGEDSHNSLIRFTGLSREEVTEILGSRLQETAHGRAGFAVKAAWRIDDTATLTGFFTRSDQFDVRRYDRLLGGDGRLRAAFTPQRLEFGYVRYQDVLGDTFIEATLSLNRQVDGREDRRTGASDLEIEDNAVTAVGYEAAASWSWGNHLLNAGGEVYDEYVDSELTTVSPEGVRSRARARFPDESRYTSLGLFLLDEWSALDDRLQITAGARYSAFRFHADADDNVIDGVALVPTSTETFSDLTFNAGATLALTDDGALFGRVARGFRAPNVNDLGEQGLTGGGFEVSPGEAVDFGAIVGTSAGPDASGSGIPWQPLSPEVLWSFETGWRYRTERTRLELTAFDSELFDTIARRTIIVDETALGRLIGGQPIIARDAAGRIFVPIDPRPVVSRANIGRQRIWGFEALLRRSWNRSWRSTVKLSFQRGRELDTGNHARKISPTMLTGSLRWSDPGGKLWLETAVTAAAAQDRLNPFDLTDARIGAFRTADRIAGFFDTTARRLGLVRDGIFLPTGETLEQIQRRVLGPDLQGAPLFTETPGFAVVDVRGAWAVTDAQELTFSVSNLLDHNYRIHGSGFDAPGLDVTIAWTTRF